MITFKPLIIHNGRRRDGTWPVKIRVTFRGQVRRLPTTIVCFDSDVTRGGRIKNPSVIEKAGELIKQMRAACDTLSPFVLESWDVDRVVQHIKTTLAARTFRLDFIAFGREFVLSKDAGTRAGYVTALNAFERFLEGDIDINEITRSKLVEFQDWADKQGRVFYNYRKGAYQSTGKSTTPGGNSGRWVQRLGHIFQAAKNRYNDEDLGQILIPRSPFESVPRPKVISQGQAALSVEVMQRVINARPEKQQERIAVAAFVLSFGTMGANLADLYDAVPFKGEIWRYNRRKTAKRRRDRAEVSCRVESELSQAVGILQELEGEGWLPGLHIWKSDRIANTQVNKYLHDWQDREGLDRFDFYAARHTWATLARRVGVEKATVDEALAHVGDYRVADIYAERNWQLAWEANRKVLELFRWPSGS